MSEAYRGAAGSFARILTILGLFSIPCYSATVDDKEEWMKLAEQASAEQDPDKLVALVQEINRLIDEKTARLDALRKSDSPKQP
jgi:hypothetical protein